MNWTFSIKNKIKAGLTILVLCAVVFLSNYRLKKLSQKVGTAVESIYSDRLVVQDLLFTYDNLLDKFQANPNHENLVYEAKNLRKKYLETTLTKEEEKLILLFSDALINELKSNQKPSAKDVYNHKLTLLRLEQIQMEEAKKQMELIHKARLSQEMGFYLETAILIILFVIAQALISANTLPENLSTKRTSLN